VLQRRSPKGRFQDGLGAFADRDLLSWSMTLDKSRAALVEQYRLDTVNERGRRFVFAYTNEEVRRLNDAIQELEIERGRVLGVQSFETDRGTLRVGEGDRIVFRGNDKPRGILNGLLATVQTIEGSTLVARTDRGRKISIDLEKFGAVELGYAGTIYRGQGKTLDEAYVLHTRHWRDAATSVALTRSRGATCVFVSKDQARDLKDLARQMSRQSRRGSTLRFSHIPDHRSSRNAPPSNEAAGRAMHRDKEREHE
jgi:ATP-dependent exoDNAse (exonuclease V) alpha subunit